MMVCVSWCGWSQIGRMIVQLRHFVLKPQLVSEPVFSGCRPCHARAQSGVVGTTPVTLIWFSYVYPLLLLLLSRFSCVRLCVTLWAIARQAPLSMGFFRPEYRSALTPLPGGHMAMYWNTGYHSWGMQLESSEQRPGVLLNILQHPGQPPRQRIIQLKMPVGLGWEILPKLDLKLYLSPNFKEMSALFWELLSKLRLRCKPL